MMGLGDVADSVIPKPVLVSAGDGARQRHLALLHAAALPRVACGHGCDRRGHRIRAARAPWRAATTRSAGALPRRGAAPARPHRGGGRGRRRRRCEARIAGGAGAHRPQDPRRASCTCRPMSSPVRRRRSPAADAAPARPITIVVPTTAGGGNDAMARVIAAGLGAAAGPRGDRRQPSRRQRLDRQRVRGARRARRPHADARLHRHPRA